MAKRAMRYRLEGFDHYDGDAREICQQILNNVYDKKGHYKTSCGHFQDFYVRDFGLFAKSLVLLGKKSEVKSTLNYALNVFSKKGLATAISPKGVPYDFPCYGPDSLAFLLYALRITENQKLAYMFREFLQKEVDLFVSKVINPESLLPKEKRFSSIRDQIKRKSSCYDMVMICVVARESSLLELDFPYPYEQLKKILVEEYWNGRFYYSDMHKQNIVTGDANIFPFWFGIDDDKKRLVSAMKHIQSTGLDKPFPLRYISAKDKKKEIRKAHPSAIFAHDYETHSIWTHLGLAYLEVLKKTNKALFEKHLKKYEQLIKDNHTFLEVYDKNSEPFKRTLYITYEGMVWCAGYLALI